MLSRLSVPRRMPWHGPLSDHDIGIIVTVSVLVAAGVAAYQSPQVQQWMSNSRRKIAVALHNLGDEIHPRDANREDISMTEEVGEAAEERRRRARAEIMRRATLIESQKTPRNTELPLNSFDTLVDNDGNLRFAKEEHGSSIGGFAANATGVDTGVSQPHRRGVKPDNDGATSMDEARLHLHIPSAAPSNHPSESTIHLTPTSEHPGQHDLFDPFSDSPLSGQSPVSATSSSHADGHTFFYAHPHPASNLNQQQETDKSSLAGVSELEQERHSQQEVSSAQSTTGSHVQDDEHDWIRHALEELRESRPITHSHHDHSSAQSTTGSDVQLDGFDITSDGTLSDLGVQSVGGIDTPASWSEVGSVVSNDEASHHQLL